MGQPFRNPVSLKPRPKSKDTLRREALRCPLPPGKKYGKLTVLRKAKKPKRHGLMVMCRCECGEELAVRVLHLEQGSVRSCGKREHPRALDQIGISEERLAAQVAVDRAERERALRLYPPNAPPKPPRESDLALWEKGRWMQ